MQRSPVSIVEYESCRCSRCQPTLSAAFGVRAGTLPPAGSISRAGASTPAGSFQNQSNQ